MKKILCYLGVIFLSTTSITAFATSNDPNLQSCQQTWAQSSAAFSDICNLKNPNDFIHYESYFPTHPCSVQATCATGVGGQAPIQAFLRYREHQAHIIDCSGQLFTLAKCPAHTKRIDR